MAIPSQSLFLAFFAISTTPIGFQIPLFPILSSLVISFMNLNVRISAEFSFFSKDFNMLTSLSYLKRNVFKLQQLQYLILNANAYIDSFIVR